jgi:formate dehydrogenase major subunit
MTLLSCTSPAARESPERGARTGPASPGGLDAHCPRMGGKLPSVKTWLDAWPVFRQLTGSDPLGRGVAARSKATESVVSRTATADKVVKSVCPYCAVGCGQRVFVKDEKIVQIEGDPDSPISRGRLCPKGSASKQLVTSPTRETKIRYRRPYGTEWEDLDLDTAMDMITDRVLEARRKGWQDEDGGRRVNRTMGIASLGGATLDTEENYLMKKLYSAMGAIQIENQARI